MKKFRLMFAALFAAGLLASCSNSDNTEVTTASTAIAATAVIENIMTRTSIRQFTDQPVGKDTLDVIVKAGMAAPSAMNKQPWAFVVVTDKTVLDSLNAVHPHANLQTATAAIIVAGNMQKTIEGQGREYWVQDCSAATENILLAAHAYGLGAVWCGVYPMPDRVADVSRVLGLPDYIIPLNIITMGYPAQNPEPKDKFKEENIHYNRC